MKITAHDLQREESARQDNFEIMLRRQGWHLIRHRPARTDPNVIRLAYSLSTVAEPGPVEDVFYQMFGENTFRKLLRHIIFHKCCSSDDLKRICSSPQKLQHYLTFMLDRGLIIQDQDLYLKGPEYKGVDNIGPTLEWYVAEWFRSWLWVPARHGVAIRGVADGGDLDVVAFVDGIRIMIECKSGSPAQITENDMRLFLQRAADFNPEIAILLIDTESRIDQQVEMLNRMRTGPDPITAQDDHRSIYWGARHIYVINTRMSIADSLSSVLRLYYSKIRHVAFWRLG